MGRGDADAADESGFLLNRSAQTRRIRVIRVPSFCVSPHRVTMGRKMVALVSTLARGPQ